MPDCVPPSHDKLDMKRLKDDIPKFFLSRSFEETHKEWWMDFLSDKDGIFKAPDAPQTWLLDDILLIKHRQRPSTDEAEESRNVFDVQTPQSIPPEIEALVAKEREEIPEVSLNEKSDRMHEKN